jgi:uncharacterized protein (DUF2461 family)
MIAWAKSPILSRVSWALSVFKEKAHVRKPRLMNRLRSGFEHTGQRLLVDLLRSRRWARRTRAASSTAM